jgi:hypothetical protein
MTDSLYPGTGSEPRTVVDGRRLWAGGLATAGVAVLTSLVGFLVARGLFGVPVLAPAKDGAWGDASTPLYALCAGLAALVATGLVYLLILGTPTPYRFFGWIMGLTVAAAVLAPFMSGAVLSAEIATAVINLAVGVVIWSLVDGVARSAVRRAIARTGLNGPPTKAAKPR